jgi:hypothetical protein
MGAEAKLPNDVAQHPTLSTTCAAVEWSDESGMRPRIQLNDLIDDDGEIITVVEPWRSRVGAPVSSRR